jgi:hypothetical protein
MTTTTLTERQTFRETVALVAAKAKARLPEAVNGRVESAVKLVLGQDVTPQDDGSILVGSSTDPLKTYRLVWTTCECQDFTRGQAPDGWCQHRIAAGIHKRVQETLPVPVVPEAVPEPYPDNNPGAGAAAAVSPRAPPGGPSDRDRPPAYRPDSGQAVREICRVAGAGAPAWAPGPQGGLDLQ